MSGTRAYSGCGTLDRDAAPGRAPGRFVDGAHRALADQRDDLVAPADRLAGLEHQRAARRARYSVTPSVRAPSP